MAVKKENSSEVWVIMLCGLSGTGKSTIAKKLAGALSNFKIIDQNKIRRQMGYKIMPQKFDGALRKIDRLIAKHLHQGHGVIFDSVNRYSFRRQQVYGVASCCGVKVLTLEVVCPERVAKNRMVQRKKNDGLVSDPKHKKVYDKLKQEWESVSTDFIHYGSDHVNYFKYNSYLNYVMRMIQHRGSGRFIRKIEKILTEK